MLVVFQDRLKAHRLCLMLLGSTEEEIITNRGKLTAITDGICFKPYNPKIRNRHIYDKELNLMLNDLLTKPSVLSTATIKQRVNALLGHYGFYAKSNYGMQMLSLGHPKTDKEHMQDALLVHYSTRDGIIAGFKINFDTKEVHRMLPDHSLLSYQAVRTETPADPQCFDRIKSMLKQIKLTEL